MASRLAGWPPSWTRPGSRSGWWGRIPIGNGCWRNETLRRASHTTAGGGGTLTPPAAAGGTGSGAAHPGRGLGGVPVGTGVFGPGWPGRGSHLQLAYVGLAPRAAVRASVDFYRSAPGVDLDVRRAVYRRAATTSPIRAVCVGHHELRFAHPRELDVFAGHRTGSAVCGRNFGARL